MMDTLTITQTPKRVRTMNHDVVNYINRVLEQAAGMVDHFAIAMPSEDLYTMLCGNDYVMLEAFAQAARYMEPANYHDIVRVPVLLAGEKQIIDVPFTVSMDNTQRYPCYLIPKHIAVITPESKWYHKIEPGIRLAQEWEITKDLFRRFCGLLTTDQIAFVLPWLKDLGRDAVVGMTGDHSWKFISKNNLSHMNRPAQKTVLIKAFERLAKPLRPSRTPALTSRINQATRLGDKLFAQHRILSGHSISLPSSSFFAINPSIKLLPEWYVADIDAIVAQWHSPMTLESNDE